MVATQPFRWAWIVGAPLAISPLLYFGPPFRCAFCIVLISSYWIAEVVPIGVTSLLPILLFPVLAIAPAKEICLVYFKDSIVLFVCTLMMTLAVEETNLHRRIALKLLTKVGTKKQTLLLGFMCTTAFLSFFLSDTACTALMIPIALAVIQATNSVAGDHYADVRLAEESQSKNRIDEDLTSRQGGFCKALVLACAHGSLIGGTAILTSTGPNLVFREIIQTSYSDDEVRVSYVQWMAFAIPPAIFYLTASFLILVCFFMGPRQLLLWCCPTRNIEDQRVSYAVEKNIQNEYNKLGPFTFAEKSILFWFAVLMGSWILRRPGFMPGWGHVFPDEGKYLTDSVPGILVVFLLFVWPKDPQRKDYSPILTWSSVQRRFPWSCMLLIGAGYAISDGVQKSGLSSLISCTLKDIIGKLEPVQLQLMVTASITAMTEFASNVSTGSILIPIVLDVAESMHIHPLYLALPATVACSFAFMLPMATPPNAIVYDTRLLGMLEMIGTGALLNICCVLITTVNMNTWAYWLFDLGNMPLLERNHNLTSVC